MTGSEYDEAEFDLRGYDTAYSLVDGQSTGIDIVIKLEADGFGTPNLDLFLGYMPDALRDGIVVMETGGPAPMEDYGNDDNLSQPSFQIFVRDHLYGRGKAKADNIMRSLTGIANQIVGATYYQYITPTSDVISLGKVPVLDGETNEFSVNFRTIRRI